MSKQRPRIVEAMFALKERRDTGELVYLAIDEVAQIWAVSAITLKERAEESWGAPLESDRERNPAHFEHARNKRQIAENARELARAIWQANLIGLKEFPAWEVAWDREIEAALAKAKLKNTDLEGAARSAFMSQAFFLEKGRRVPRC